MNLESMFAAGSVVSVNGKRIVVGEKKLDETEQTSSTSTLAAVKITVDQMVAMFDLIMDAGIEGDVADLNKEKMKAVFAGEGQFQAVSDGLKTLETKFNLFVAKQAEEIETAVKKMIQAAEASSEETSLQEQLYGKANNIPSAKTEQLVERFNDPRRQKHGRKTDQRERYVG